MQVFLMLRTAYTLLRFCIFFISFHFGDDNISLDIESYEIRFFFFYGGVAYIILKNTYMIKDYVNTETYPYV